MNYQIKPNAFEGTFAFLPSHRPTKKSKEPTSQSTVNRNDAAKMNKNLTKRKTTKR